jgi:glutamine amidotransferase
MCELLALSFNLPVAPCVSFKGFRKRGEDNPDGWGLAFYPDKSVQIFKEPLSAKESFLSEFVEKYHKIKSQIFIAHVRKASKGSVYFRNTHPFNRELNGREYVFAHNGTLLNYEKKLKLGRFRPIGETDSEYVFCHLLSCIEERKIKEWGEGDFKWLSSKLRKINEFGSFNCLLSDGKHLFAYHDMNGYNALQFLHRKPPYSEIRLIDEDWRIDLGEEKDPRQKGYIIATRRLTNEEWKSFRYGELMVFKDGELIYSNKRKIIKYYHSKPT